MWLLQQQHEEFENSIQSDIFACIKNERRYENEIRKGSRRKDVIIYCFNILLRN